VSSRVPEADEKLMEGYPVNVQVAPLFFQLRSIQQGGYNVFLPNKATTQFIGVIMLIVALVNSCLTALIGTSEILAFNFYSQG